MSLSFLHTVSYPALLSKSSYVTNNRILHNITVYYQRHYTTRGISTGSVRLYDWFYHMLYTLLLTV